MQFEVRKYTKYLQLTIAIFSGVWGNKVPLNRLCQPSWFSLHQDKDCAAFCLGECGICWEQNVLYLFWPETKHLKAFSRFKRPVFPLKRSSPAKLQLVAVVVSCFRAIMWELWAAISLLLSRTTERLLLMTYFGNQKHGPLSTQDKMASDEAWLAGLKCVKTGSLITVFRKMAKTCFVGLFFCLLLFWFVLCF